MKLSEIEVDVTVWDATVEGAESHYDTLQGFAPDVDDQPLEVQIRLARRGVMEAAERTLRRIEELLRGPVITTAADASPKVFVGDSFFSRQPPEFTFNYGGVSGETIPLPNVPEPPEGWTAHRVRGCKSLHVDATCPDGFGNCDRAPTGWKCTRGYHHEGSCAAVETPCVCSPDGPCLYHSGKFLTRL